MVTFLLTSLRENFAFERKWSSWLSCLHSWLCGQNYLKMRFVVVELFGGKSCAIKIWGITFLNGWKSFSQLNQIWFLIWLLSILKFQTKLVIRVSEDSYSDQINQQINDYKYIQVLYSIFTIFVAIYKGSHTVFCLLITHLSCKYLS